MDQHTSQAAAAADDDDESPVVVSSEPHPQELDGGRDNGAAASWTDNDGDDEDAPPAAQSDQVVDEWARQVMDMAQLDFPEDEDEDENDDGDSSSSSRSESVHNDTISDLEEEVELIAPPPKAKRPLESEVIDLLDDDEEEEEDVDEEKKPFSTEESDSNGGNHVKKPRLEETSRATTTTNRSITSTNAASAPVSATALSSYLQRASYQPSWMKATPHSSITPAGPQHLLRPPPSATNWIPRTSESHPYDNNDKHNQQFRQDRVYNQPHYLQFPPGFRPTWRQVTPPPTTHLTNGQHHHPHDDNYDNNTSGPRVYQLSLLNVSEFTIEGLPPQYGMRPTSIAGLRVPIRQISRQHGRKAVYERDKENGGGRWRIPLSAYHDLTAYLQSSSSSVQVHGIPANQLQIATLERARQEKGFPTAQQLIESGVPAGLAQALAPFQRGGVDFVKEKNGRALIADDMGLGKTIQSVASMSMFYKEWPLLVLCPSGARYHWENEFKQWLGVDSAVNKDAEKISPEDKCFPDCRKKSNGQLLKDWQIHVLTSSKGRVLPNQDTRVVICSYGLAPTLIQSGAIRPGMFRCAIVDESHMLKNKSTKRTQALLPILSATDRCVLLSGTPALARPIELWPQLAILRTENHGWGDTESQFIDKYVKNGNSRRSAELHTMLTGTVMIRRLKNDILKTLPKKIREKATVYVLNTAEQREKFHNLMDMLRESKGALGSLARTHQQEMSEMSHADQEHEQAMMSDLVGKEMINGTAQAAPKETGLDARLTVEFETAKREMYAERKQRYDEECQRIRHTLDNDARYVNLDQEQRDNVRKQMEDMVMKNLEIDYRRKWELLSIQQQQKHNQMMTEAETKRTAVLTQLYGLTGEAKLPLIVSMLRRFLADKTKGKICIFAHHISVLNAIRDGAGLSNSKGEKFIRIDGSTLPRERQDQINAFQTDPRIRVALLGITAAGVAVTLTASATVWFTELFWTPAIMIQAEDRCHRIGQSAQVKCLYFVARGTLDDVLWKLIEKKFRDLGEFVEGKEKLKLIVDKEYTGAKELQSAMFHVDDDGSDDGDGQDDATGVDPEFELDGDLVHDIEELGEEERRMLQESEDPDDGDGDGQPIELDTKIPAKQSVFERTTSKGLSEDDAIALSDDEEVPTSSKSSANGTAVDKTIPGAKKQEVDEGMSKKADDPQGILEGCRLYRIIFPDKRLGLEVTIYNYRVVVAGVNDERLQRLGHDSKPSVGDILVGIAGSALKPANNLGAILQYLKSVLENPPTEFTFAEAPRFVAEFKRMREQINQPIPPIPFATATAVTLPPPPFNSSSNSDMIELLDDD